MIIDIHKQKTSKNLKKKTMEIELLKLEVLKRDPSYDESIINTVRESLIILNGKLEVVSANKSFYNSFKVKPKETVGQLIYDLGNKQWNIPKLRKLLEEILPENTSFDDYEVEHDFPHIGRRIMLLNARRIPRPPAKPRIILLAIEDVTDKKATQETLEETEEKFRQFFENSNDAIFITDPVTRRLVDCNMKAEKLVGRSKTEILSMRADNLHPTDRVKEIMKGFKKQIESKAELVETEVLTKAGERIYVEVNSSIVQISGKKYIVGVFRNITERKKAEEELIAERNKIKTYLDSLVDGVTVTDKNANIIEANKAYVEMLGYKSPLDIIGKPFTNFVIEKEIPRLSKNFTETIKNKELFIKDFEVINKRKDGSEFPTMVNMRILWNEGEYAGCISVIRDITESKKAEEKLKESEARYRSYIEATKQLGWTTDAKGLVIEDIPTWRAYTGQSFEEIKNWGWVKAIHPDDAKRTAEVWEKAIKTKSIYETEYRIRGKDGKYKWFLARGIPVLKEDGSIREWVGICIDISERIKIEEEIKGAQEKWVSLTENTNDVIMIIDDKDIIQYINKTIPPYTPEETVGKLVYEYVPREQQDTMRDSLKKVFKTGKSGSYEISSNVPKIGIVWFTTKVVPIKHDGRVDNAIMISTNITERKKVEEEIKKARDKLQSKVEELERFNRLAVGRELKMVELKNRIKELEKSNKT